MKKILLILTIVFSVISCSNGEDGIDGIDGENEKSSFLNIKNHGIKGDGSEADTDKMQYVLDNYKNIFVPSGDFIFKNLRINHNDVFIYGGKSSRLTLDQNSIGFLLDCQDKTVILENITFSGNKGVNHGVNQRENKTSTANRSGLSISSQRNSIVKNCTFTGFAKFGLKVNDKSNRFLERFLVDGCLFKKCWSGLDTGEYGEYTRYANCQIVNCQIGITLRSGNINVNNFIILKNAVGVFLKGSVSNDGHGSVNNSLINHNDYAILSINIINGFLFTGNNFFEGICEIRNSSGINIVNNILNLNEYKVIGGGKDAGLNFLMNNKMFSSHGNIVNRLNGGKILIRGNYFEDGTFLEGKPF